MSGEIPGQARLLATVQEWVSRQGITAADSIARVQGAALEAADSAVRTGRDALQAAREAITRPADELHLGQAPRKGIAIDPPKIALAIDPHYDPRHLMSGTPIDFSVGRAWSRPDPDSIQLSGNRVVSMNWNLSEIYYKSQITATVAGDNVQFFVAAASTFAPSLPPPRPLQPQEMKSLADQLGRVLGNLTSATPAQLEGLKQMIRDLQQGAGA